MLLNKIQLYILTRSRKTKRWFVFFVDMYNCILAVWLSYYLRTGEFISIWKQHHEYYPLTALIVAILFFSSAFYFFRLYHVIFRYLGYQELIIILKVFIFYGLLYSTIFTLIGIDGVPRTVGIIQPLIFFLLTCFSRFCAYFYLGSVYLEKYNKHKKKQILIYGAGSKGYQLARALSKANNVYITGFIDDDISLQGNKINNVRIYNSKEIDELITKKKFEEIIFALEKHRSDVFRKIFNKYKYNNIRLRLIPSYQDIINDTFSPNQIRDLSINDILGREPVPPVPSLMKKDITNKIVLVSGAGGTIGGQLCKEILNEKPKTLILLDHSEFALYEIYHKLKKMSINKGIDIVSILGSVVNESCIERLFKNFKINTIYHAAAYKHVKLVEENVIEGVNNNIIGTLNLANEAINNNVRKFVLISTDKAVKPKNIMGASKKFCEVILQALSEVQNNTLFSIVRFGNVLGSSGSVVPLFKSQIKIGGPVTVTHPNVTRYFMTVKEAAQLVIQAGAMTDKVIKKTKTAPIFLLDMGKPIKIYELAKLMIELYGFTIYNEKNKKGDIKIKFIGLTPGEKLHEELFISENSTVSEHQYIKYTEENFLKWTVLENNILILKNLVNSNDIENIKKLVLKITSKAGID